MSAYSRQKKKTWDACSKYVRRRDMISYKKLHPEINEDITECITCGRVYPIKKLQAGHFIAGRTNGVLFDLRGIHSQCYGCNVGKNGNMVNYYQFMEKKYGKGVIDELQRLTTTEIKYTIEGLKDMENTFNRMSSELT